MPDDFDRLSSLYEFKEGEAGGPYVYMNGAVWPHTTSWYILGHEDPERNSHLSEKTRGWNLNFDFLA